VRLAALGALVGALTLAAAAAPAETPRPLGGGTGDARLLPVTVAEKHVDQGILTPVPIAIDLPQELDAARVLVHFKVHGSPGWTTLELRREGGNRFRGAIPCLEVSTITGDLRYYVRVHDAEGAAIAYRGTRADPFLVRVIHESERPDLKSGARCPDPADCPRGLPGCPSEVVERIPCKSDGDCEGGTTCGWDGYCEHSDRRKNWIGLRLSGAVGLVPGTGACALDSQENEGYSCLRQRDGVRYIGTPVHTNEPVTLVRAPLRAELGYERLVYYDVTVGARAGYAFLGTAPDGTGAGTFVPWSVALSATRWFGHDPFARTGVVPYVTASGGLGMFDLLGSVHVREDPTRRSTQGGNDLEQTLDVWKRAGDAFVGVGGGVSLRSSTALAVRAELGLVQVFPYSASLVALSLGADTGF
jgi:hypothetical protein